MILTLADEIVSNYPCSGKKVHIASGDGRRAESWEATNQTNQSTQHWQVQVQVNSTLASLLPSRQSDMLEFTIGYFFAKTKVLVMFVIHNTYNALLLKSCLICFDNMKISFSGSKRVEILNLRQCSVTNAMIVLLGIGTSKCFLFMSAFF